MVEITEDEYYEGVSIDLVFEGQGPTFGDLFAICGYENPNFPPSGNFSFERYSELQFSQVDDYFGVQTHSGEGDDVAVWLYPFIKAQVVDHNLGPFDGLRITYNVLRNPIQRSEHFLHVLEVLSGNLSVTKSISLESVKEKISAIEKHWSSVGIVVGSSKALELDY